MWRISGNVCKSIRACVCRTPTPVTGSTGGRCNLCSKPGSAPPPPPGAPKAPPPPPHSAPQPGKKSSGAGKVVLGGLVIGAGATVGAMFYAKTNPEFRQQVESNWPILLDVFPYFFDEEAAEKKTALTDPIMLGRPRPLKPLSSQLPTGPANNIKADIPSQAPSPPQTQTTKKESVSKAPVVEAPAPAVAPAVKPSAPRASQELQATLKKEEEARRGKELEEKLLEEEIDRAANIAAYEAIVDSCMSESVEAARIAIETNQKAVEATKLHTEKLKLAMAETEEDDSQTKAQQWDAVVTVAELKLQAVTQAGKDSQAAREALAKLKTVLEDAKQTKAQAGTSPVLVGAQSSLNQMTYDLDRASSDVVAAQSEARILKNYHELIEKGRETFKKEVQSLMPEAKIGVKGKKLTEEELNALLAHAHRRVYQMQRELSEQQAMEQQRLAAAIAKHTQENEGVTKSQIAIELERQAADLAVLHRKKQDDLLEEAEQELRLQLRRQAAAHSDHLSDVLRDQETSFERRLLVKEGEVREQERDSYHRQITGAMAKLRGVEAAVEGRAGLELQNRKAQELWLACETLKQTIFTGKTEGQSWDEKLVPLADEVIAIKEAAPENEFVKTVIQTLPEEAINRGVYTEDSIRQRWEQTRRVCQRVAMIDETGGSMWDYALSFFQSLLILSDPLPPLSDVGLEPSTLDTFKLVAYASYHLENGNLEQALRYANQLTGMPRAVAQDWLREARLLLETSQAASVLSSHASASGLGGLHFE